MASFHADLSTRGKLHQRPHPCTQHPGLVSALRKRLTQEAPAQAAGIDAADSKPPRAPLLIEYNKCTLPNSPVVFNTPKVSGKSDDHGDQGPRLLGRDISGKQLKPAQSLEHLEPTESQDLLLLDLPWPGRVRLVL